MNNPHRRYNPLTDEWILVSPHRTKRPWQGKNEENKSDKKPAYDPNCYLCPGNIRAGGLKNPDYKETFVFVNDFSAITNHHTGKKTNEKDLIVSEPENGICKVVCYNPRHDLSLSELNQNEIKKVVQTWQAEYDKIGSEEQINYVQIFENKGTLMGASNPHPHGQIWAQETVPMEPMKESRNFKKYYDSHKKTMLYHYISLELKHELRIIYENRNFIIVVPFWAVWPFETMIISREPFQNILDFNETAVSDFAEAINVLSLKYDKVFNVSFPYSSGIHQSPTDGKSHPEWHFHMHFYPPLLRSAKIKKFMVGYEMLGNPQRDITAEYAAELLKKL